MARARAAAYAPPTEEAGLTLRRHLMDIFDADRRVSVNNSDVPLNDLEKRLRDIFESRRDKTLFLAGAGTLRYGDIIQVIDAAKGAGVEKVGIVTEGMRRAAGVQTGN